MPILVQCPGCQKQFRVSDKFAGKQGPCPQCKAVITIPSPDDVKIHVDEYATAGKDTKGRPVSKPIRRRETKFAPIPTTIAAIAGVTVVVIGWLAGEIIRDNSLTLAGGVAVVSVPIAAAGYAVLRDPELEPYTGFSMWIRAGICGLLYAMLWAGFWLMPDAFTEELWSWVFVAPAFIAAGGFVALASLDFDFGTGAMHYCFYLFLTLTLRAIIGMEAVWAASTEVSI